MIPYDDLVVALATWRAKQGLPVGQMSGALTPTPPPPQAAPITAAPSTGSGSGPKRGPPVAPPAPSKAPPPAPGSGRTAAPAPLPLPAETIDVDEHMVDDEPHLEPVDDFAHAFSNIQSDGDEQTAIGSAPGPQTDPGQGPLDPKGSIRSNGNRNDDW